MMGSQQSSSDSFEWLADLQKSQCYTTCDWANPAKSTDFGSEGFTASITDWHELLQLTAPDKVCGIVFVRGNFPNTPDAILARAQTREDTGSKGTFDIHFVDEAAAGDHEATVSQSQTDYESPTGYTLGEKRAQGLANFQWPFMQYELQRKGGIEVRKGGYEGISFVKDGTMFQINRLTAEQTTKREIPWPTQSIKFRLGGKVQFGCPCSNGIDQSPTREFEFSSLDQGYRLVYNSKHYNHRLEIQAFVDGEPKKITSDRNSSTGTIEVALSRKPTIIITTYTLRNLSEIHNESDPYPLIPMLNSIEIQDYLGISDTSLQMTDKLWLASLTKQFDAVETLEICAVARYVEQILGVSSVPIARPNTKTSSEYSNYSKRLDFEGIPGIALVRNIITSQYVELESVFWQVRFLVKAYNFLTSRTFEQSLLEQDEVKYLKDMRRSYLARIGRHIQLALVWMTKAQVKPEKVLLPISPEIASTGALMNLHSGRERGVITDSSYNQACFTRIALCYVHQYCSTLFTPDFRSFILARGLGNIPEPNEGSEFRVEKESTPKNDVLLWFDMSCLLLFWQEFHPEVDSLELQSILISQERREKIAKRLRKKQSGSYSMEDEEVDRLFLLGEELGLQNPSGTSAILAAARVEQTRSRIANRKRTETFNCGPRLQGNLRSPRLISNAPWELALLNHHTLLQTSLATEVNISQSRDACFEFLLSDYTFMVSWDRADKGMIGKWWDIEPGAVICSTLLDKIGMTKSNSTISTRPTEDLTKSQQFGQPSIGITRGLEEAVKDLIAQIETHQESYQFSRSDRVLSRDFDWRSCRPSRIYHLKAWVQSLDDTPAIFNSKHATFAPQRIIRYLTNGNGSERFEHPKYSKNTVRERITPDDTPFLSTFDFKLNEDFTFMNEGIVPQEHDRVSHYDTLLKSLNDCLVDRDTKYRILFAEQCCPEVVSAFAYVWHPDALDTFDNYFGTTSRFSDTRDTLWTTTITISHWKLLKTSHLVNRPDRFYEGAINAGRKDGEFPPKRVAASGIILEERSSSLVITGDVNGYNWICSLWSSLTDCKAIKADIDRLPRILHLFIHKQATARCLIFLIILGHICGKLASEYIKILKHLDSVVELGEEALFKGLEWEPNDSIDKLKRMIWGGQALRIFDDRLSASLSQIRNAKEAMDQNIKQDGGQSNFELLKEYMSVLEGFEKHFSNLSNVQVRIQHKIKHVIGLRDGISTVTNVEDSRTALSDSKTTIKQGNNIQVLTLLTIVYLPLGYVTGLFSENHGILPNNAGKDLYAGLVVLFTVATYGLALSLDKILAFLKAKRKKSKYYFIETQANSLADNSNQRRGDEATPVGSRETTTEGLDMAKHQFIDSTCSPGWRRSWGGRNYLDKEIPLESVRIC